jgi:hypothetical protein
MKPHVRVKPEAKGKPIRTPHPFVGETWLRASVPVNGDEGFADERVDHDVGAKPTLADEHAAPSQ